MNLQQIDLNLFLVFDAVYRERNLTRAAEALAVTQPAISNALTRLRRSLDDPLFVRTAHGMLPTPVADNLAPKVSAALQLLDAGTRAGADFNAAESNKVFRLSLNDLAEVSLLPRLLERVQQEAPAVRIESYYVGREQLVSEMTAGRVDLGLDVPLRGQLQLRHQALSHQPYVCLLRPDHPLKRLKTLEDYLGLKHILVSNRRSGLGHIEIALEGLGVARHVALRTPHYMMAAQIVDRTDLALTAPASIATRLQLKALPLPFSVPDVGWNLYWHKNADQDGANRWLREHLIALFDELV
jgi:DNA-binding transcriptional LysR family regulator